MRVVLALDAGPMLAVRRTAIGPAETSAELEGRLAELGADLLADTADRLAAGPIAEQSQPEAGVTYAHRLERRESLVDWVRPAADLHNQIRGLQPWPVATVLFKGRRLLLLGSDVASDPLTTVPPGTVADVTPDGIIVAAAPGAIRLTRVQIEGRGPMAVRQFLAGHPVRRGDHFDPIPIGPAVS
jgi:methionyl-tRNA formyltransferase